MVNYGALQKARLQDIPEDAVLMSRQEAVQYQIKVMMEWDTWKEVFFFKYGSGILGAAAAGAGLYFNLHYRRKLSLRSFGFVTSILATSLPPCAMALLFHHTMVIPNVVLQDTCAVCMEMRAAALQSVCGCIIPNFLTAAASFSAASSTLTYDVPSLKNPKQVFALWRRFTVPIGNPIFALFLAQAMLAAGVTVLESRSVDTVNAKMLLRSEMYS